MLIFILGSCSSPLGECFLLLKNSFCMILSKVTEYVLLFHTSIAFTLYNFEENGKKKKKTSVCFQPLVLRNVIKHTF